MAIATQIRTELLGDNPHCVLRRMSSHEIETPQRSTAAQVVPPETIGQRIDTLQRFYMAHHSVNEVFPRAPLVGECKIHFEERDLDNLTCCRFSVCRECTTAYVRLNVSEGKVKVR